MPSYLLFLFAAVVAYVGVRHFCVPSPRKPLADTAFLAATFGYTLATHPALAAILLATGLAIKFALKIAPLLQPPKPQHIQVVMHLNPDSILACPHSEWTKEQPDGRQYCVQCGTRSEGSCQP